MNYDNLIGKEIVYKHSFGEMIGIVTGCDLSLGITIQSKEDPDVYICCLHGPLSPVIKDHPELFCSEEELLYVINEIEEGIVKCPDTDPIKEEGFGNTTGIGSPPSVKTCVFSQ